MIFRILSVVYIHSCGVHLGIITGKIALTLIKIAQDQLRNYWFNKKERNIESNLNYIS